jgi:hypothetical protein
MTPQQPVAEAQRSTSPPSGTVLTPGSMEVMTMAPRAKDRRLTTEWLDEITQRDPGSIGEWQAGKVCQVCGDIATVRGWEEWVAAHAQGGEFFGFKNEHYPCTGVPPGGVADRGYRFCEICQGQVPYETNRRVALSWLCEKCETSIRKTGHALETVLSELSRVRLNHYEANPVRSPRPDEGEFRAIPRKRVPPPEGWLPPGLFQCGECGEVRGTTWGPNHDGSVTSWKSTCLCEGFRCKKCGERTVRRPTSSSYNTEDGHFWHTPYFMGTAICRACAKR